TLDDAARAQARFPTSEADGLQITGVRRDIGAWRNVPGSPLVLGVGAGFWRVAAERHDVHTTDTRRGPEPRKNLVDALLPFRGGQQLLSCKRDRLEDRVPATQCLLRAPQYPFRLGQRLGSLLGFQRKPLDRSVRPSIADRHSDGIGHADEQLL